MFEDQRLIWVLLILAILLFFAFVSRRRKRLKR